MKRLNLKTKLVIAFLLVGLIPLAGIGYYAYNKTSEALEVAAYDKLAAVRAIKASSIKRYFESIRDQVITFSEDEMVVNAMTQFKKSFKNFRGENKVTNTDLVKMKENVESYYRNEFSSEYANQNPGKKPVVLNLLNRLDKDSLALQYHYISNNKYPLGSKNELNKNKDNSKYSEQHGRVHPIIANYLKKFGYYDIFLVDSESGDIIYSVFKELDFSTSLIDGPYANTNFGEAFRSANRLNDPNEFVIVDYKKYGPSYESPASFIASPIFKNGKRIGVAIFQMPIDKINGIMGERDGMGMTGETYLIGNDSLMRSDSFKDTKNHSVVASFKNKDSGKISTIASKRALNGEVGRAQIKSYSGESVLSSYSPIDILGLRWAIVSETSETEALNTVITLKMWMIIVTIAVSFLILLVGVFMGRRIAIPILKIAEGLFNRSVLVDS
ncbi:MAG: cache domain-containing protein [Halobacteriovoraceae bacterium]|jgi:methyl-accepting chemotaxis protein|nr:cache domain-containing protein [Halobacteriovoraceae bacterium]